MSHAERTSPGRHVWRGTKWVLRLLVLFVLLAALGVGVMMLTGARLALPDALVTRIASNIDRRVDDLDIALGRIVLTIDRNARPRLFFEDIVVRTPDRAPVLELGAAGVVLDPVALLSGRVAPKVLRVDDPQLTLRRDRDGRFALRFGGGGGPIDFDTPGALIDAIEDRFGLAPLDQVERVEMNRALVVLDDARSARVWQLVDGSAVLTRVGGGLSLSLDAEIFDGTDNFGSFEGRLDSAGDSSSASLSARAERVRAADIALQSPALSALQMIDAPVSAFLRGRLGSDGRVDRLDAELTVAAGAFAPVTGGLRLPFDAMHLDLSYDPSRQLVELTELSVAAPKAAGRLQGTGQLLDVSTSGIPGAIVMQIEASDLRLSDEVLFSDTVEIAKGRADLRLRLNPFSLEVGEWSIPDPDGGVVPVVSGRGLVAVEEAGWRAGFDLHAARLSKDLLLTFWPQVVGKGPRRWVENRLLGGEAYDASLAIRKSPEDQRPFTEVSFGFREASTQAVDFLPPVTDASGYVTLHDNRFVVRVDTGVMEQEGQAPLNLSGSTFTILDTAKRPSDAVLELAGAGDLASLLTLLDRPPLRLMERIKRTPDLLTGSFDGGLTLKFPVQRGNTFEDMELAVQGTVRDMRSDRIVPGRVLTATGMRVEVDKQSISATGQAALDGIPFDGRWQQRFGAGGAGRVDGVVQLTPAALAELGVTLPDGLVSGQGRAQVGIDLGQGQPPRLALSSDLKGVGLSIGALGWSKPAATPGRFELAAVLSRVPEIQRMALDVPGLDAEGRVTLGSNGGFEALTLDRVALGGWFNGAVRIASRGKGVPPAITVTDGSVDMRRANLGGSGEAGESGAARGPISLSLDRLVLTDTVSLRQTRVDLAAGRALKGAFSGRVNGGVQVQGQLDGEARGTAVRLSTNDAGALLRDAGLVRQVQGGQLSLVLRPTGQAGTWDGALTVKNPVLRDAPAIAELLSAISVVGLLEQLNANGIPFEDVSAEFRIAPDRVTLYRSSAVGASLGLSVDGLYYPQSQQMDLQGVVSPIYLLNRIGSIFTRRGEGLFGVNFTLSGPVSKPRVGANPLSILTPGMFREIFRRPPPQR
ncbi:DUF3971 domain-containing protein [Palleronia caenipelagi]|uniref:AsmA-like C-terminal domain-containing protein n=1 Tax=Palleronia caenipelagi TaxID=2489174 RepID=A0A547Q9M1_9RHOB|nr:AsmA-like C-terminal region-containing protein [Palleronia caenipelagi]TRD23086.1 hypothetical protein FEV53_02675 [Palleronia caenipelagi]